MKTSACIAAAIFAAGLFAMPAAAQSERVRLVNINGYSIVDDEHVILTGGASRYYLVTLRRACWDMEFGVELGTSFRSNQTITNPRNEYITTDDGRRCYIDTIEEVDSRSDAIGLIAERAGQDAAETDPGSH